LKIQMSPTRTEEPYGLITRGDLRRCIDAEELQLHYQPVVDLVGGAVCGVEAVLCWQRRHLDWRQPDAFLALVTASDLMKHLDYWVLETAGQQMARWRSQGLEWNLSVRTSLQKLKRPSYRQALLQMLDEQRLPPRQLTLVFNAEELSDDADLRQLAWLSARGVVFSIGTVDPGYMEPAWLLPMPIQEIRLVRPYHDRGGPHRGEQALASLLAAATRRHLRVVATDVGTRQEFRQSQALGIDRGQGNFVCPPMAADLLITHLLRTGALNGA